MAAPRFDLRWRDDMESVLSPHQYVIATEGYLEFIVILHASVG